MKCSITFDYATTRILYHTIIGGKVCGVSLSKSQILGCLIGSNYKCEKMSLYIGNILYTFDELCRIGEKTLEEKVNNFLKDDFYAKEILKSNNKNSSSIDLDMEISEVQYEIIKRILKNEYPRLFSEFDMENFLQSMFPNNEDINESKGTTGYLYEFSDVVMRSESLKNKLVNRYTEFTSTYEFYCCIIENFFDVSDVCNEKNDEKEIKRQIQYCNNQFENTQNLKAVINKFSDLSTNPPIVKNDFLYKKIKEKYIQEDNLDIQTVVEDIIKDSIKQVQNHLLAKIEEIVMIIQTTRSNIIFESDLKNKRKDNVIIEIVIKDKLSKGREWFACRKVKL